jgi:hypothetical protein
MKNRYIHAAFIGLLGLCLSMSLFAQGRGEARGTRGETPQRGEQGNRGERGERGERGNRGNEAAERRKAVQAQQKASIDQENARFKLAMMSLRDNAKNAKDSNAKNLAKLEADAARRSHEAELKRIRAQAQAAINALKK